MNRGCCKPTAEKSSGLNQSTIVATVGDLFFPRSSELGLRPEDNASMRVVQKMVYAGVHSVGYQAAADMLREVGGLSISAERIRRACDHAGRELIDQQEQQNEVWQRKPIPEQSFGSPDGVKPIDIACIMDDGGRYQRLDRNDHTPRPASARKGEHWKESRIGVLARMTGQEYDYDPQPVLPPELRYQAMADTLAEIGKTGAKLDCEGDEEPPPNHAGDGIVGPELVGREVIASGCDWNAFGPLLASQAWEQGFAAATRKVVVSDGSQALEKLHRTYFSHFTSVLDLLHALSYSLAAARAVSENEAAARVQYDAWAALIWEGRVAVVIDELLNWQTILGDPPDDASASDPRNVVRASCVYYENQAGRMNYPAYRQAGFPLTSSLMESTVKQVSRRVKGSEKFWSRVGSESMLRLRAAYLCDSSPMTDYWNNRRTQPTTGHRTYRQRKPTLCP